MVTIAHASIDERGKITGGSAGDQTGKEVCTRTWYNKPWGYVLRFKDRLKATAVAYAMKQAAANPRIGYDQGQRNTLLAYARNVGYDPGKVTALCETDCSALVAVACMYAGVKESVLFRNGNSATTRTLRSWLNSTGLIDVFSDKSYTTSDKKLQVGDILLSEGHHVAVVVEAATSMEDMTAIAKEVLAGAWGNGADRKARLTTAGYDYATVQAEVNKLLKGGK